MVDTSSSTLSNVARHEASPPIPEAGIVLVADYDRVGFATLRGAFRIALEPLGKPSAPLQSCLVLVAKPADLPRSHRPIARKPFHGLVLLDGDDDRRSGLASGWFNVPLVEVLGDHAESSDWLVWATLGQTLSTPIVARLAR